MKPYQASRYVFGCPVYWQRQHQARQVVGAWVSYLTVTIKHCHLQPAVLLMLLLAWSPSGILSCESSKQLTCHSQLSLSEPGIIQLLCCTPGKQRRRRGKRRGKKLWSEKPTGVLLQSAHNRLAAATPAPSCLCLCMTSHITRASDILHNVPCHLTLPYVCSHALQPLHSMNCPS